MDRLRQLNDQITIVIAQQLHNFEFSGNRQLESFEEMQKRLDPKTVIDRYRNDVVFHAKVTSIVSRVMRIISAMKEE